MDCFYAAIEMRDNPQLRDKPIAVGGAATQRGVLCTCNYIARSFGIHSAMATAQALRLCPNLILLPVNMAKYRQVSKKIHEIFHDYTELVEPLSLDEAFLDVTNCTQCRGSATLIATAIRKKITQQHQLTASAGVAPNKFLAKIASDWNKPDGQLVIPPHEVANFVRTLPVSKIFGVGKVTANKLENMGIITCADLQKLTLHDLINTLGNFGAKLYELCRGIDNRQVKPKRIRKSLSVEETYANDLPTPQICLAELPKLIERLKHRLSRISKIKIKKLFIKIKFFDFTQTTVECLSPTIDLQQYETLFWQGFKRQQKPVRLLGIGVRFANQESIQQLNLIDNSL